MRKTSEFFFSTTKLKIISSKQWKIKSQLHTHDIKLNEIRKTKKPKNVSYRRVFKKFLFFKIILFNHFQSQYPIHIPMLYLFNHSLSSSHDRERVECNVSYLSQRKHVHVWLHARIIDCRATILRRHSSTYVRYIVQIDLLPTDPRLETFNSS